jgi:hypothetical protein
MAWTFALQTSSTEHDGRFYLAYALAPDPFAGSLPRFADRLLKLTQSYGPLSFMA